MSLIPKMYERKVPIYDLKGYDMGNKIPFRGRPELVRLSSLKRFELGEHWKKVDVLPPPAIEVSVDDIDDEESD